YDMPTFDSNFFISSHYCTQGLSRANRIMNLPLNFLLNPKPFKFLIHQMRGQSHHSKVRAFDLFDTDHADPFLDAVGTGLVQGLIFFNIIIDFFVGKLLETYAGGVIKNNYFTLSGNAYTGSHMMKLPA